jgi:ABC-type Mn2+/Zn2+ transport system permease subunit
MGVAVVFGVSCVLIGLTIAFYADISAGGAIVLTAIVLLLVAQGYATIGERRRT